MVLAWTTEKRTDTTKTGLARMKYSRLKKYCKSPWRASYHVEPQTGLLNDPNGFSFDGKWIVFCQKTFRGPASSQVLGSTESDKPQFTLLKLGSCTARLPHWTATVPLCSAMQFDDKLFLFAPAMFVMRIVRHPYQIGALIDKSGKLGKKINKVLIDNCDHWPLLRPQILTLQGQFYMPLWNDLRQAGYVKLYKAVDNDAPAQGRSSAI